MRGHSPNALASAPRSPLRPGVRVNAAVRAHPEPVDRSTPGTGSGLSAALGAAVERARTWAGDGLCALLLSGSHASGEAVWAEVDGRRVSLSDLDLYAVMRDEAACTAARARAAADRFLPGSAAAEGLAAALEVAFVTFDGLARMPARPGTVDLVRSGRVIAGDTGLLARLPRWEPAAVSAEERRLLLENRAFDLLAALHTEAGALSALRSRHAVLKVALDAATARGLAHGELPAAAAERVARARELGVPDGLPSWLAGAWTHAEPLWQEALVWRAGEVRGAAPGAAASDADGHGASASTWRAAARVWAAAWWADPLERTPPSDPWERALRAASRGSLARRFRRSLAFRARTGATPGVWQRARFALAGTPALRIHGSAVVLLLAAAQSHREPRLPAGALYALHRLGVTRATSFDEAARETVAAWDGQLHDGQRTVAAR